MDCPKCKKSNHILATRCYSCRSDLPQQPERRSEEGCAPCAGYAARAEEVEMDAARASYAAGFGVSEWESFLTARQTSELNELAALGYGTWGRERHISE